jgi:hypothetical protein
MLDESRPHCVTEQSLGKQRDVSRIKETPRVVTLFESAIEVALAGIISAMTLVEITFELQSPLTTKQLADLAEFANTYGLRRFRHDEAHNLITFEYDASACAKVRWCTRLLERISPSKASSRNPAPK